MREACLVFSAVLFISCGKTASNTGDSNGEGRLDSGADIVRDTGLDANSVSVSDDDVSTSSDAGVDKSDVVPSPPCATYATGKAIGALFAGPDEISGIVESRDQPGVLWIHEDSDNAAILYAITRAGRLLGEWQVQTDFAIDDWEDIALEPIKDGPDLLFVGDIGDNAARDDTEPAAPRESIWIARVAEPLIDMALTPIFSTVEAEDSFEFTYPDNPHDAEALAVDPVTGDLYIFAKEQKMPSTVFRARAPLADGVLEVVASLQLNWLDAADFSPNGDELLVRNYWSAEYWSRSAGETWDAVLAEASAPVALRDEPVGESIGFAADASGFYTISEQGEVPIWFYEKTCS